MSLSKREPDIRLYRGKWPQIAASAYIDPAAVIIGDVVIGEDSSVWPKLPGPPAGLRFKSTERFRLKLHASFILAGLRCASILVRRQFAQRHPFPSVGIGTCGSSAHQQPPSGRQVMAAPHCAQRVSTER